MKEKKKCDLLGFSETCKKLFSLHAHKTALCVVSLQIASIGRKAALFLKVRRHILYIMQGTNTCIGNENYHHGSSGASENLRLEPQKRKCVIFGLGVRKNSIAPRE